LDYNDHYSTQTTNFSYHNSSFSSLSGWQAACSGELHSITADPSFSNLAATNFHLASGSSCIDAGDTSFMPDVSETDIDTMARIQNGRIDIGADEFGTAVGILAINDVDGIRLLADRNTGELTVIFDDGNSGNETEVMLISVEGKVLDRCIRGKNEKRITFNISALPPATYIIAIPAENISRKFVK
jgi:hypothetical protein